MNACLAPQNFATFDFQAKQRNLKCSWACMRTHTYLNYMGIRLGI